MHNLELSHSELKTLKTINANDDVEIFEDFALAA